MEDELTFNREIEQIIAGLAKKHGISHQTFSDGWIHTFQKGGKTARLVAYCWSLNNSAASLIASDKVAAYEVLNSLNIPAVPHTLVLSRGDNTPYFPSNLPSRFLIKPLRGTAGQNVILFEDVDDATQVINHSNEREWAMSPFMNIEREVRVILLDDECLLTYEKVSPVTKNGVKFFNLSKGAAAKNIVIDDEQLELAVHAKNALGLRLAAIDIVYVENIWQVLEINSSFMMEHYIQQSLQDYETAVTLYEHVLLASLL